MVPSQAVVNVDYEDAASHLTRSQRTACMRVHNVTALLSTLRSFALQLVDYHTTASDSLHVVYRHLYLTVLCSTCFSNSPAGDLRIQTPLGTPYIRNLARPNVLPGTVQPPCRGMHLLRRGPRVFDIFRVQYVLP